MGGNRRGSGPAAPVLTRECDSWTDISAEGDGGDAPGGTWQQQTLSPVCSVAASTTTSSARGAAVSASGLEEMACESGAAEDDVMGDGRHQSVDL